MSSSLNMSLKAPLMAINEDKTKPAVIGITAELKHITAAIIGITAEDMP